MMQRPVARRKLSLGSMRVVSYWGLAAALAVISLPQESVGYPGPPPGGNPPAIVDFGCQERPYDLWKFTGKVVDESPGGLTITFGDLLAGHSTTTAQDGTFEYWHTFPVGTEGTVTARTVDNQGNPSNLAECLVNPTP